MKLSLSNLILLVAILSVLFTLLSGTTTSYKMSQQTLIDNTLETNRVYAKKLADITDSFFTMTLQSLQISSERLAMLGDLNSEQISYNLTDEANRLKEQTNTFNSVLIVNANGKILATSPQTLELVGEQLRAEESLIALKEKKTFISKPYYVSLTDRTIIFISQPIFDAQGVYLGLVGGSLYVEEQNILYDILGEHFYSDGSYVYVVDGDGKIIYHQDHTRINDQVLSNTVVQKVTNKESGSAQVTNTKNIDMLAGYAYIPTVGWGVVSQRPTTVTIAPTTELMKDMILRLIPYLIVTLILIWIIARLIARPLNRLANLAETSTTNNQHNEITKVNAWYYEAIHLKKALNYSLNFFHERVIFYSNQSKIDPLTKLANRRTLDEQTKLWVDTNVPFSIVIIDIDYFKKVNDTYGHAVGDEVLKFLAQQMTLIVRSEDVCCRYGGEEFVILLKNANEHIALQIAERLRQTIEASVSPSGEHITVSAGIASYPYYSNELANVFDRADQNLYTAKNNGRNQCVSNELQYK